ncbi:hypothetical protein [Persephonella sp.]
MKIYSVEIGKNIRKGLTVHLKEKLSFFSFDKKSSKLRVSIFFPDIIYSSIVLPEIDDEETVQILLKSRMSALLEEGKNYSFVILKKERISENETLFDVYGIPTDKFFEIIDLVNENPYNIELFTVDIFSLAPISKKICGNKTCFHFYGDTEKALITVSKGDDILYVRSIPLPEITELKDLTNIYYENFNMTYVFTVQTKRINVESIVISGKAASDPQLLKLCEKLTNLKIKIPSVETFISGISQEDFMEYLIPVGTALLNKNFDFTPSIIKKEKALKGISKFLSLFSIFLIILLSIGIFTVYAGIKEKENQLSDLKKAIQKKISFINKKISKDELGYFINYIKKFEKSEDLNPVFVFDQMPSIFEVLNEKMITIENKDNRQIIQIFSEQNFSSLSDMLSFKLKINEILRRYKNIQKNIQEDKENLSLRINLRIEREIHEDR